MKIYSSVNRPEELVELEVVRCMRDGSRQVVQDAVQEENVLEVFVDGERILQTRCSANYLDELVIGRLITTGVISSVNEIDCLTVSEPPLHADVWLYHIAGAPSFERKDGTLALERIDALFDEEWTLFGEHKHQGAARESGAYGEIWSTDEEAATPSDEGLAPVIPIPWSQAEVFAEVVEFATDRTSHRKTRGTHSAYLFHKGELLLRREDIGRHNAFDKVVGAALLSGVDLTECTLFTSGRVPTDMCAKAVRARIPIVVSKAVPTVDTVKMARAYDLTLICKATPESFEIVNDPLGVCRA